MPLAPKSLTSTGFQHRQLEQKNMKEHRLDTALKIIITKNSFGWSVELADRPIPNDLINNPQTQCLIIKTIYFSLTLKISVVSSGRRGAVHHRVWEGLLYTVL